MVGVLWLIAWIFTFAPIVPASEVSGMIITDVFWRHRTRIECYEH